MSKNTNLSFLADFLTADIVNTRVGINNASPQTTLDVTGTGKFSGVLTLGSTVSNGIYAYTLPSATGTLALTSQIPANPVGGTGSAGQVAYWSSSSVITGESNLFWDATNDRLGIGTATPNTKLQIVTGSSGNTASFSSDATAIDNFSAITINSRIVSGVDWYGSEIRNINTGGAPNFLNPRLGFFTQDNNTFLPAGRTEKLSILGNGNVGIGTVNPLTNLQVGNGTQTSINGADNKIHIATNSTRSALLTLANSSGGTTVEGQFESSAESADLRVIIGSASNHAVAFRANNSEAARIFNNGNFGIGTGDNNAGFKLDVNGTGRFSGNLRAASFSSIFAQFDPYTTPGTNASPVFQDAILLGISANAAKIQYGNEFTSSNGSYLRFQVNSISAPNTPITALTLFPSGAATFSSSVTATSLIRSGGTSSQFLKADGSVDSTTYASGNFYAIDYLVVAGGGGGGGSERSNGFGGGGAGGGAGGLLISTTSITSGSSYTIVVGAGGAGGASRDNGVGGGLPGTNGGYSQVFDTITIGGGQGQGDENGTPAASTGGSGGGRGGDSGANAGSGTLGQGNGGGNNAGRCGGGGGGATTSGGMANDGVSGGVGGNGIIWFDGSTYSTGGGGGGGNAVTGNAAGGNASILGGIGSRSTGNSSGGQPGGQATPGATNTGAGGGGAGAGYDQGGQNGGSGIVIIRYAGAQRGTGGTVTTTGGYTYHRFFSSGTFTA